MRGAVSTGFRAPNLNQSYYGHVSTGFRTDPNPRTRCPTRSVRLPVDSEIARGPGGGAPQWRRSPST
jgi:hypothetical protein